MKKLFALILFTVAAMGVWAQESDIFQMLQDNGQITITQSKQIEEAVLGSIYRNVYKKSKGFRVRIFFDNNKTARDRSATVARTFKTMYPNVSVYRVFEDLYFKVAVGDFRTKTEAMRFLQEMNRSYPSAFIISEPVNLRRGAVDATEVTLEL